MSPLSNRRIRAVFFDLDDTLCDTVGTREARARLAFEAISRDRPEVACEAFVARVMESTGERIVRGVPAVAEEMGLAGREAGRSTIRTWFFDACIEQLRCIEGVRDVTESLSRQYVLGIVTNGAKKLQHAKFSHLGFEPFVPLPLVPSISEDEREGRCSKPQWSVLASRAPTR